MLQLVVFIPVIFHFNCWFFKLIILFVLFYIQLSQSNKSTNHHNFRSPSKHVVRIRKKKEVETVCPVSQLCLSWSLGPQVVEGVNPHISHRKPQTVQSRCFHRTTWALPVGLTQHNPLSKPDHSQWRKYHLHGTGVKLWISFHFWLNVWCILKGLQNNLCP